MYAITRTLKLLPLLKDYLLQKGKDRVCGLFHGDDVGYAIPKEIPKRNADMTHHSDPVYASDTKSILVCCIKRPVAKSRIYATCSIIFPMQSNEVNSYGFKTVGVKINNDRQGAALALEPNCPTLNKNFKIAKFHLVQRSPFIRPSNS